MFAYFRWIFPYLLFRTWPPHQPSTQLHPAPARDSGDYGDYGRAIANCGCGVPPSGVGGAGRRARACRSRRLTVRTGTVIQGGGVKGRSPVRVPDDRVGLVGDVLRVVVCHCAARWSCQGDWEGCMLCWCCIKHGVVVWCAYRGAGGSDRWTGSATSGCTTHQHYGAPEAVVTVQNGPSRRPWLLADGLPGRHGDTG